MLWERIRRRTPRAVEDVQRRLAGATAGWAGGPFGRAVPPPPWSAGATFVASAPTESRWLSLPVVLVGEVRAQGEGAILTGVIRPHGAAVAPYAVTAAFLAGAAFAGGAPLFAVLWLVLVGAVAFVNLSSSLAERSPAIHAALAAACGEPDTGP